MTTYTDADIRLAHAFADILLDWLGDEKYEQMKLKNVEYGGMCCASHDYCDANMAMLEAWPTVYRREYRFDDEADTLSWNRAWDAAHALGLICHKP